MLTRKDILLNSSLKISYPQNTKPYSLYTTKIICFLFFIFSVLVPVQSICNPSDTGDTTLLNVMFCNPKGGEEYEIGQIVMLSWNPVNAYLFSGSGQVQVYLFRMRQNATGDQDVVPLNPGESKEFLVIPRSSNSMNFTVELGWLPTFKYSIPFQKHSFEFRVIPFGSSDKFDRSFSTPSFVVIQPDDSSSSSPTANNANNEKSTFKTEAQANPTVTVTTPILDSNQENKPVNKVLIVVIAVAGLAAFLAFMAIVIATCGRKRNKNPTMLKSQSNLSTSSSTPMIASLSIGKFGSNNRDSESPIEAESIHSTTPLSNKEEMRSKPKISFSSEHQPISASDAALLSDAFRTVLRKPDWKPEDEDEDDVNLSNEELLRRRGAKERMEKELAEEGTDLQNISKRHTKVEIHNTDEELENGSGRSSESGSK